MKQLQLLTLLFLPFTMAVEMLYQSTGNRLGASLMSSARSGLFFIPSLLILSALRGLSGIQEAQPLAYVLAFPLSVWFVYRFVRSLPKTEKASAQPGPGEDRRSAG